MDIAPSFRIVQSSSGAARVAAGADFLREHPSDRAVNVVAFSRGAADDLVRLVALERGATIGLARYSLTQIAARAAAARLAGRGIAPATALGARAVATRATFDALGARALGYFGGVADRPGFPAALAATVGELREARISADDLRRAGGPGADLARLLAQIEHVEDESTTADRAALFAAAADGVAGDAAFEAPLLLLDVDVSSRAEESFIRALVARASRVHATVPLHDTASCAVLERAGGRPEVVPIEPRTDVDRVREHLFAPTPPVPTRQDGTVEVFSAPGEGRECVEIARRVLHEARRGVRFDEMAVLVRTPRHYQGLLEHAFARGGIPAWFERGTRRPHPAGRAFLALLACADEGLPARRFAEYLSLGEVPAPAQAGSPWVPSSDEVFAGLASQDRGDVHGRDPDAAADREGREGDATDAASEETVPTPRRWERLLVDAAVVGGDPGRWSRRLDGLAAEFARRLSEARREDPESPRAAGLERDLIRLSSLRAFAMPLVTDLGAWSSGSAHWGDWLDRLARLAPRVLRTPAHVLRILADLRPMSAVGPVHLAEVRAVLRDRLLTVETEPAGRRYGRVFVATPAQARGRSFRVVFVPGLAERMFPQKPRQDPLLLDEQRAAVDRALATGDERARRERLLLHLATGAAQERLYVSFPRIEVSEGRARVPSFYALDLVRGATGRIPDHEDLAAEAAAAGDPMLAWPAPADPSSAIDDQEHDLSVLRGLLDVAAVEQVRGHAQYLLTLNPALRRTVTERWARAERRWSALDGLHGVTERTRDALAAQRFGVRPYSLSALQRFAQCPYQFLLSAIYRLQPAEMPHPIQRLDPLMRGSLVHRIQAEFLRELQTAGTLPVTPASLPSAAETLGAVIARAAAEAREDLVPAIDRVWRDEIAAISRDLRGWLAMLASDGREWTPQYFELAFGLPHDEGRDPRSVPEPVTVGGRFPLRGSVDLVETHRATGVLRVTDHKTGKNWTPPGMVINGGRVLQPVVYSLVVEAMTGGTVAASRLSFCTAAGGFTERSVPLTETSRRLGVEALEVVDRALESGTLAPSPADGACRWCDFRPVCGPDEEARLRRKPTDRLPDLFELRSRP